MSEQTDRSVLEYRIARIKRAPRNWTLWVAAFTAFNALFIWMQQDLLILAGLVAPFMLTGPVPHVVAAGLFVALALGVERVRGLGVLILAIYVADTLLAAYLKLWAGVVMHIIVLAFVGNSFIAARVLAKQLPSARNDA